jgi:hypothetical protein
LPAYRHHLDCQQSVLQLDNRYLMCATTAVSTTGECIWGPCFGLSLQSLPIEIADGQIYAKLPGADD